MPNNNKGQIEDMLIGEHGFRFYSAPGIGQHELAHETPCGTRIILCDQGASDVHLGVIDNQNMYLNMITRDRNDLAGIAAIARHLIMYHQERRGFSDNRTK